MSYTTFRNFLLDYKEDNDSNEDSKECIHYYILKYFEHLNDKFNSNVEYYLSVCLDDDIFQLLWDYEEHERINHNYLEIKGEILEGEINVDRIIYYVDAIDKLGEVLNHATQKVCEYMDNRELGIELGDITHFDELMDRIKELKREKQELKKLHEQQVSLINKEKEELTSFIRSVERMLYIMIIMMSGFIIYRLFF